MPPSPPERTKDAAEPVPSAPVSVTVVCMDCGAVKSYGGPDAPISHGLCDKDFEKRMAALDAEVAP